MRAVLIYAFFTPTLPLPCPTSATVPREVRRRCPLRATSAWATRAAGYHADPLALIVSAGARKEKLRQREFAPGPPRSKPLAYVELRAASAFSFLDGASLPEDLVEEAARREIPAVALVDANGVYGAPRFYKAAKAAGVRAMVGAEVTIDLRLPAGDGRGEGRS